MGIGRGDDGKIEQWMGEGRKKQQASDERNEKLGEKKLKGADFKILEICREKGKWKSASLCATGTSSNGGTHWLLCLANPVITRLEEEEEAE
ncbi:hypothetical protein Pmani_021919 [Petrolisthes manimaculis]|uniref:Uncharacterized protein n=1 Tax=Petrolisthes manimaculis TaxID=1843537 RepID=A0AAE1PD37_9EUCA|nr:hypothetical protein Pmani_021919 [Petrolisthes manimaculis]